MKCPLWSHMFLNVRSEYDNVVAWHTLHNEFDVVDALLVWFAVTSGVRMPSSYTDLPAPQATISTKRSTMRNKINMAYSQAVVENERSCAPTVAIRLSCYKMATIPNALEQKLPASRGQLEEDADVPRDLVLQVAHKCQCCQRRSLQHSSTPRLRAVPMSSVVLLVPVIPAPQCPLRLAVSPAPLAPSVRL